MEKKGDNKRFFYKFALSISIKCIISTSMARSSLNCLNRKSLNNKNQHKQHISERWQRTR